MAWPLIVIYLLDRDKPLWLLITTASAGIAIAAANAILSYINFTFYIIDNELTVSSGYIQKKQVSIPIKKIQSLNLKQNLLQQLIGIHTLEVNTAGSKGAEIKLPALGLSTIQAIERMVNIDGRRNADESESGSEADTPAAEVPILHLSPADLLKVGISNNHIKVILFTFSFLMSLYNDLPDKLQHIVERYLNNISTHAAEQALFYILMASISAVLLSVIGAIVASIAWFYNLNLWQSTSSLTLEAGLISRKRVTIPFRKIQTIRWSTNPVRRLLGLHAVTISQASGIVENEKIKAHIPGCRIDQVSGILQSVFGTSMVEESTIKHHSHWLYMRNHWLLLGAAPAAVAATIGYLTETNLLWASCWAIVYLPFAYLAWKKRYFYMNESMLVASSGCISHEKVIVSLHKIQGISMRRSVWQEKKGRANVRLYTAGEVISLPQLDIHTAATLRDYVLYVAESNSESWM